LSEAVEVSQIVPQLLLLYVVLLLLLDVVLPVEVWLVYIFLCDVVGELCVCSRFRGYGLGFVVGAYT